MPRRVNAATKMSSPPKHGRRYRRIIWVCTPQGAHNLTEWRTVYDAIKWAESHPELVEPTVFIEHKPPWQRLLIQPGNRIPR